MTEYTGADALCDTLLENEIDVCFANPGTSEMHFVAALDRKPGMRCVLGLFEGVVTGAADGYARMKGVPAATLLHTGPGLANGLANLHNARRASTPMINVVGDHAAHHLPFDAPLTSDIESLARPMSGWVHRIAGAGDVAAGTVRAVEAARGPAGQIATLILPADAAWSSLEPGPAPKADLRRPDAPDPARVRQAAEALRANVPTVILLAGASLREEPLRVAAAIATTTDARLLAQQQNARIQRGAGRVAVERIPYDVDAAVRTFADVRQVIYVGSKLPVAFFAYPGKPSHFLPDGCAQIRLAFAEDDLAEALRMLAAEVGASPATVAPASPALQALPSGQLTIQSIASSVGNLLPEDAIICDESVTSGRSFFASTHGAAQHDHLQLTGGAIGIGLPLAVGAAVACPDRKVLALQADGSAMYTNQALWTMASEGLDVVVVLFANRRYAILQSELKAVGAVAGASATRLMSLDNPAIDWVRLAQSMGVEARRVETADQFNDVLKHAFATPGPFLIEALV